MEVQEWRPTRSQAIQGGYKSGHDFSVHVKGITSLPLGFLMSNASTLATHNCLQQPPAIESLAHILYFTNHGVHFLGSIHIKQKWRRKRKR